MNIISEKFKEDLKKWSEGNEYLYSLLYLSWQHGIRTGACCGGHIERTFNGPYIQFIIDEKNLSYFESIIGAMEDFPDISMEVTYRGGDHIKDDSRFSFIVRCMMHNRMETFYKLADSIINNQQIETQKGKEFYEKMIAYIHQNKKELKQEYDKDTIINDISFSTKTDEYKKYRDEKRNKLYHLKQLLKKEKNKYDKKQIEIDENPQIRY